MDLNISTRFADWIRPDLLDLEGVEMRRIGIDNYELEEQADPLGRVMGLFKKQGDTMQFSRDTGFGPWSMADLAENQQLDSAKIDSAVTTLDNLEIVGVRKKTDYKGQQLLNADLSINQIEELQQNVDLFRQIINDVQGELAGYGFNLSPSPTNPQKLSIVSTTGELNAGTNEGVVYTVHFGDPVSGDDQEIEIGTGNSDADAGADSEIKEDGDDETAADAGAEQSAACLLYTSPSPRDRG